MSCSLVAIALAASLLAQPYATSTSTTGDRIIVGLERDLYLAVVKADALASIARAESRLWKQSAIDKDEIIYAQRRLIEAHKAMAEPVSPSWVWPVVMVCSVLAAASLGAVIGIALLDGGAP